MTTEELITKLEEYPSWTIVLIEDKHNGWKCEVDVIIDGDETITLL
jgi:hypothetical protein